MLFIILRSPLTCPLAWLSKSTLLPTCTCCRSLFLELALLVRRLSNSYDYPILDKPDCIGTGLRTDNARDCMPGVFCGPSIWWWFRCAWQWLSALCWFDRCFRRSFSFLLISEIIFCDCLFDRSYDFFWGTTVERASSGIWSDLRQYSRHFSGILEIVTIILSMGSFSFLVSSSVSLNQHFLSSA